MTDKPKVLIVGAGLAGCLLARLLGRTGHDVLVCEAREDPRESDHAGGRSINLAISRRGIDALERAGLRDRLLEKAIPMPGRMIHDTLGKSTFQPYSADASHAINSVSRSELNLLLIEAADEHDCIELRFGMRCSNVDHEEGVVEFTSERDGSTCTEQADIVVGADGAGSAVRAAMERANALESTQDVLEHGYKELTIPPVESGPHAPFAIQPKALHIWPHGAEMMIALPNQDGSFTCTLFWPYKGERSFESVQPENVKEFFRLHYPDAGALMPDLEQEYRENPVSLLGTIRCAPWHVGRTVLIGDAAHAIVPFYGQGANASFEDSVSLAEHIEQGADDLPRAMERYFKDRVEHANAIADMALANFLEMRDHTGKRWFRYKKKLEQFLHRTLGDRFIPLYEMVSFTTIPYDRARRRAARQWRVVSVVGACILVLLCMVVYGLAMMPDLLFANGPS
ncbi:MAG: FAD-dependent monooxygenase [Phycisphaerales bacterium]|nr:FAD-dependent monooxygenase [Phycisphaerales bacterium]